MRKELLVTAAAALVLSCAAVSVPYAASAQPSPHQMKKAGEIKNPVKADARIAKIEDKDARKQARRAHKDASRAWRKARSAARAADKADIPPHGGQ